MDKYWDHARELKKTVKQEDDCNTNSSWCTWLGEKTRGTGNQQKNQYHPDHTIVEIGKNIQS